MSDRVEERDRIEEIERWSKNVHHLGQYPGICPLCNEDANRCDVLDLLSEIQRLRYEAGKLRGLFKWSHDEHHGFFRPGGVDFDRCPEHPCLTARDLLDGPALSNTLEQSP